MGPGAPSAPPQGGADEVEMSGVFREDGLAADTAHLSADDTTDISSAAEAASGGDDNRAENSGPLFHLRRSFSSEIAPGKAE